MGIGNVSIGGDVEDLMGAASRHGYMQCPDGKWRESCVPCSAQAGNGECPVCGGLGFLIGAWCDAFTDAEMWQYMEDDNL